MERRYWEPPNSLKLLLIILAVPLILLAMIPYWVWLMTRLAVSKLRRVLLPQKR